MFKFLGFILDRIFVFVGGLTFLQFPLFMQQYQSQLAGHVAELEYQVNLIRLYAMQSGKTVQQFIQKFLLSPDADFSAQGKIMAAMLVRLREMSHALESLRHASKLTHPFIFLRDINYDIAKSTLQSFQPGFPFTLEGLIYIIIGMIFGYFVFWLLQKMFTSV